MKINSLKNLTEKWIQLHYFTAYCNSVSNWQNQAKNIAAMMKNCDSSSYFYWMYFIPVSTSF